LQGELAAQKATHILGYFLTNQPKPVRWERLTPLDGSDTTGLLSRGEIEGKSGLLAAYCVNTTIDVNDFASCFWEPIR
jgi:hypothetical protein